jgi:hypothetical protein
MSRFFDALRIDAMRAKLGMEPLESRIPLSTFAFGPIAAYPAQLPPAAVAPTVSNQSGFATVQIDRAGHGKQLKSTDQVQLTMSNGSAVAGVDYAPVDQTLTFKPGQTVQTVIVPLLNSGKTTGEETANLTLTESASASSGEASQSAVLTIPNAATPGQPAVEGIYPVLRKGKITQIQVTFNEPMNAASLENLSNYYMLVQNMHNNASSGNGFGGTATTLSLRSASYDPGTLTVTLTPDHPLMTSAIYDLYVDGAAEGGSVADADGNPFPNPNAFTFGAGRTLHYATTEGSMSTDHEPVSINLSGPGTMIVDDNLLFAVGTNAKQTVLSGINNMGAMPLWTIIAPDGAVDHTKLF